jgi:hypothetical protein
MGAVPVFLCIDLEPTEREARFSDPERWRGVDACADHLERLRPRLAEATGADVRFLWFVRCDPAIGTAFGSPDDLLRLRTGLFDRVLGDGDRVGVHPHAWRSVENANHWVVDHGDTSWVEHCVATSFETYRAHFGAVCALHRFGDGFLSTDVVRLLTELGARFDLTVEPGAPANPLVPGERSTGSTPDYARAPREPYRPSAGDFLVPDPSADTALWLIPQSSADPSSALPVVRRIGRKARRPFRPSHRPLTLYRAWSSPQAFWDLVERHVDSLERPYLAFALRSEDPAAPDARRVRAVLDELAQHPLARRLRFTDPASAGRELGLGDSSPGEGRPLSVQVVH